MNKKESFGNARSKGLLVLTVSVIILVSFVTLHTAGVTGTGKRIEFQSISKGYYSGHTNPAYYVIQNADQWKDLWNQHTKIMLPQHPPPEVNFSKTTIIAVFMGQFSTGGYEIEVKEMIDTGLSVVVKVEKIYPGKGCIVTEAFSQPYHIVRVDKIDKHVIFNTSARTTECG
ncbi:MAG: hypothetical protein AOA65_1072 [Candidatus Bathyarchaeota archaeon BA1]|nr:MAG: hypothetical protein AOA65_1072 [Candidatus Bathyarchaeota archaeon BA1]